MAATAKAKGASKKKRTGKSVKGKYKSKPLLSNTRKPADMSVSEWQAALRKQIAEHTPFTITNTGNGLAYSDYNVYNNSTKNTYKVALRSSDNSQNFCSCYDFKTNQLGTCKHIEAVLLHINKKPALRRALKQPYEAAYSSMYMEYRGERKIVFRIGTDNTEAYKKLLKPFVHADYSLSEKGYDNIDKVLQKAFQINASFRCYEDALAHIIQWRENKQRRQTLTPFIQSNKLPGIKSLKVNPFPYQAEGILFCVAAGRSILADDMGLGKTIQAISMVQLMHEYFQVQKVLVICPTSLKYQWQSEIEKFTTASVKVIEGNYLNRRQLYKEDGHLYKIASYHMAVNDLELINAYQPDLIILDEAQRIKNWQTKVSQSIKKLQSKYALVLTGTPLENKLQELYSLVQFINPLLLGSLYNFTSQHEQLSETGQVVGYKDLDKIKEKLKDILLRRTKKQVLQQLPARIDKNLFVEITQEQKALHNDYGEVVTRLVNRWQKTGFLSEEDRQRLLLHLNMMRMVCNSTYILDQETNYQTKLDELFSVLEEILQTSDEKIVIFSQWERFTRLIAQELDSLNIGYANLNGTVPGHKRKALFDRFNNDAGCRIFLSTDAGGVGLNLQAGSYLFNMDLPWNPAVLEQRIARIYRHGQKNNVNIINFIAQHTIEHGMLGKLKFKTALSEGILDNGEANIFIGDSKFNVFMKSVEELVADDAAVATVQPADAAINETMETTVVEKQATLPFDSDDDIKQTTQESVEKEALATITPASSLLSVTSSFITQLTNVLGDASATANLVQSLTRKDESTGQTYLQIPVENEAVIKNAVTLLAGLFKGISKS
ncbi:DEAD/DEAH box helicase [Parafilimonas sp.]|uniref:DEAD/DEAH box helicase n=1 Tax=Parafilimonas sp. TaxID=1969739 RepID=UPI0039E51198